MRVRDYYRVMVFNPMFNTISVISVSYIGGGNQNTQGKPLPQVTDKPYHIMLYECTSP